MRASDIAYRTLRDEIIEWKLPPGTVLGEVEQAARLGVSRTPLREALSRLSADGLVQVASGRGLVVSEVSLGSIREMFEVRQALEERAASLAAQRRDKAVFLLLKVEFQEASALLDDRHAYYDLVSRFDGAVDTATGNPYLVSALRSVRTHLARIRRLAQDDPERLLAASAEHLLIVEAIVAGDAELAAHATHVHLYRSLQNVLKTMHAGHVAITA
ncbi:MAG: GntR family transcriptional regulator [Homoserinimonas sp.]|jgi:DNA-binding GntR family transcriptional regulator|nr:GntR family transcriptional regulator [Homoserinimonas sp.]